MKRIVVMLVAVCFCFGMCMQTNVSEAARGVHSVDYFKGDGTIEKPAWRCFYSHGDTIYKIDVNSISHVNGIYSAWIHKGSRLRTMGGWSSARREFKKDSSGKLWTRTRWHRGSGPPPKSYKPTRWEMVAVGSPIKDKYKEREMLICLKAYTAIVAECTKYSVDYLRGDGTIENPDWRCFYMHASTTYEIDVNSISHMNGIYSAWIHKDSHNIGGWSLTRREFKKDSSGKLWTRTCWHRGSGPPPKSYEPTPWELISSNIRDDYKKRKMNIKNERLVYLEAYMAICEECMKQKIYIKG